MSPRCDDWATTNTPGEQCHLNPPISFDLFGLQAVLASSLIAAFALATWPSLLVSSPRGMPSQYPLSPFVFLLWPWSINLISSSYTDLQERPAAPLRHEAASPDWAPLPLV